MQLDYVPTHRGPVSYIDKSREYYLHKGYGNPYRWASHREIPFTPLLKPLSQSRIGLFTTTALNEADGVKRPHFAASAAPAMLYTDHLSWHKTATHTDDPETFLPMERIREAVADGRIGSLSPRFYGVPTRYSQRRTNTEDAPALLSYLQEDGVDVALLVPM
ncbi:MAG: hypothetical protein AAF633_23145 [Chloroflexota bacterium]